MYVFLGNTFKGIIVNKLYRLLSHKLSWLVAAIAAGLLLLHFPSERYVC